MVQTADLPWRLTHSLCPAIRAHLTLLFKHSTTTCTDVLFIKWDCLWESPSPHSAQSNTSAGRQRCIGPCHHVWINNVRLPAICLSKHRCRSIPWHWESQPGGRLDVTTLKISGSFFGACWPWCKDQERDTRVVTTHTEYTLHTSEMSVTRSVLRLLILVLTFCRCSVHTFLHCWINKSSVGELQNGNSLTGSIVHSPTSPPKIGFIHVKTQRLLLRHFVLWKRLLG